MVDVGVVDAEPVSPVFHSINELSTHIRENRDISGFYAPNESSFPGYVLLQIEVLQDCIIYYYMPGAGKIKGFSYDSGITVTYFINNAMSLNNLSNQVEVGIDARGYMYDKARGDLSFTVDSSLVIVHVPDSLNDYETIKSLCTLEKISLE